MKFVPALSLLVAASLPFTAMAESESPMAVNIKRLSMESALTVAKAAVEACRKEGIQIGVTVVDRGGNPQVVLRDVLAPDLTLNISKQKAYTAISFIATTSSMENRFTTPFAVAKVDGLVMSAGGVPIQAGGIVYGAVGVSGAPSGVTDEMCAQAGVDAIKDDLEMEGL